MFRLYHWSLHRIALAIFGCGVVLHGLVAASLPHAGYLNAFYHYHVAVNLVKGRGLPEAVIWNYLDQPTSQPRPACGYWRPLVSLVAWGGMSLRGAVLWQRTACDPAATTAQRPSPRAEQL